MSTYLGQDTQITQTGHAILLNTEAISQLSSVLKNGLGPKGATKMLITPAGEIRIVKNGLTLLRNIQLAQPGASLLSRILVQQGSECGDGLISTVLVSSTLLNCALEYIQEGVHPQTIISGILQKEKEIEEMLKDMLVPAEATDEWIRNLARTSLRTKFAEKQAEELSGLLVSAISALRTKSGEEIDLKMIEVIKMMNIDSEKPVRVVSGLVMDHGGRHPMMPKKLENVFILCTNISFEYEKPELNAQFYYKSTEEKMRMEEGERRGVLQRVEKIIRTIEEVARANSHQKPQFMVITQKGIDQHALEIFARHNVLALRRAKKRNMERLQKLTGCTPIVDISELSKDVFGFAGSVREITVGEDMYTFIEKTPFSRACTILVQGTSSYQMDYLETSMKSALKSVACGISDKGALPGGASVFFRLAENIGGGRNNKEERVANAVNQNKEQNKDGQGSSGKSSPSSENEESKKANRGAMESQVAQKIWKKALLAVPRVLSKNLGHNSVEAISKMRDSNKEYPMLEIQTGEIVSALERPIVDNYTVVANIIRSSSLVATKILMVDEIVKSGKEIK